MKIAIYINNKSINEIDCTDLSDGNPGIGGTEYCILLLAQLYKKYYPENQLLIIASSDGKLPAVDEKIIADDIMHVPLIAKNNNADVLIISSLYCGKPLSKEFFKEIESNRIKTITWGHNFYLNEYCNYIAKSEWIKANVFVGRQQYDRYIDHKVIKKSTYIYNMYPQEGQKVRSDKFQQVVTYIGSLVPAKGFHILASAWKYIISQVPDAQLNVIGSGTLYSRNSALGKYGIAEESYENQFMSDLTDYDGNIMSSVHFLGVLGKEKDEFIKNTSVGVVNPTGRTETFGISALDFESTGVPVVTIAKGGFLDTVIDGQTGILYRDVKDISKSIVYLLKNTESNNSYGQAGILLSKEFLPEKIIGEWDELFHTVLDNKPIQYKQPNSFMSNNLKWIRYFNRNLKNTIHFEYPLSVISLESLARNVLRRFSR